MNYGVKRRGALNRWLSGTKRTRKGLTDYFNGSFECKWQNRAENHISLFCSLGQFSTNITDILTDQRFDNLYYNHNDRIILRQYSRLLLVISEVLDDLKETYRIGIGSKNDKSARKKLTKSKGLDIDNVMGFINNVCKHKCKGGFHKKNHHIPLCFADAGDNCCNGNVLDVSCVGKTKCDEDINTIFIPKLDDLIDCVIYAYQQVDILFEEDPVAFNKICNTFSKEPITA